MEHVIVGMDPHKRSATIEVIDAREMVLTQGRFGTGQDGCKMMLAASRRFPARTWAAGGCGGIGRHLAQRLIADGEIVVDVPAKLSARARVFATGQGRKSNPAGAHSVAVAALRTDGLQVVAADGETVALRLLADRRDGLGHARTDTVNRLHRLLPGITARRGEEIPVRPAGTRPARGRAATRHCRAHTAPAGFGFDVKHMF